MNDLIEVKDYEIEDINNESRIVKIDLTSADTGKAATFLNQMVEGFNIAKDQFTEVTPEKRYYLDLTKEMKDKLNSGEAWFTEKAENGKPMGQLRHRVDGKNIIMANPDIVVEEIQTQPAINPQQLSESVYQMALQQQMAEMSQKIDEIGSTVKRIEEGQMDDRFAKIDAGGNTLRLAYQTTDPDKRRELITNAIPLLQEGSESIKIILNRRVREFEEIPSKSMALKLKMWMTPTNYVEKKDKEFDAIQDCFEYYDRAQKLTALAFMMLDEPNAMEEVFFQQEAFINSLSTKKLRSIEALHYEIDFTNEWFHSTKDFLDKTRLQYLDFAEENYNVVSIELTGKQMLEVLSDDKDSESGEEKEQVREA